MNYPVQITANNLLPYYREMFKDVRHHDPPEYYEKTKEDWIAQIDDLIDRCVASDLAEKHAYNEKINKMLFKKNVPVPYKFITLAYSPELKPLEFVEKVREFQNKKWKWANERVQRFEFYSKEGYNPHLHMFVWTNKKKSQIIKELSSKTGLAPNFIDVRDGRYKIHIDYVRGEKQTSKEQYMEKDKEVRTELDIEEYEEYLPESNSYCSYDWKV